MEAPPVGSFKDVFKAPAGDLTEPLIEKWFGEVASTLLNRTVLVINKQPFRMAEIEFYLTHPSAMPDPYPHNDPIQVNRWLWYFHRSSGKSYRGGTYKGLDITIGDAPRFIGGILIRSLLGLVPAELEPAQKKKKGNDAFVCGPCKLVDHILTLNGYDYAEKDATRNFVETTLKDDLSVEAAEGKALYLRHSTPDDRITPMELLTSGRVGLNPNKTSEHQMRYVFKSYRYFLPLPEINKGRALAIMALHHEAHRSPAEIAKLTGATPAAIAKCLDAYEKGKKKKAASFVGEKLENDEAICTAYGAIRGSETLVGQ